MPEADALDTSVLEPTPVAEPTPEPESPPEPDEATLLRQQLDATRAELDATRAKALDALASQPRGYQPPAPAPDPAVAKEARDAEYFKDPAGYSERVAAREAEAAARKYTAPLEAQIVNTAILTYKMAKSSTDPLFKTYEKQFDEIAKSVRGSMIGATPEAINEALSGIDDLALGRHYRQTVSKKAAPKPAQRETPPNLGGRGGGGGTAAQPTLDDVDQMAVDRLKTMGFSEDDARRMVEEQE